MKTRRSAFTLIELLIVVAIIAILAAIAVPNFLEAQTRAKVGRVCADMRSIGLAIEAYRTDNPAYPPSTWYEWGFTTPQAGDGDMWYRGYWPERRLRTLTTPIAYMTKAPQPSPFKPPTVVSSYANYYQYSTLKGMVEMHNLEYLNTMYALAFGKEVREAAATPVNEEGPAWMIVDTGPDAVYFFDRANGWTYPPAVGFLAATVFYDPTNGTVSAGDIVRSQARSSFQ
jgi:prepilin-type N-terminal cleavage/methylation domain-containing protein